MPSKHSTPSTTNLQTPSILPSSTHLYTPGAHMLLQRRTTQRGLSLKSYLRSTSSPTPQKKRRWSSMPSPV
eukprot:5148560-Ditylum_brightwellii.AAC.1